MTLKQLTKPAARSVGGRAKEQLDPSVKGLRERKKEEKLARIRAAAHALFVESGYTVATMRDIAAKADVGLGTLFRYARDKRDLLILIHIDDFQAMMTQAFEATPPPRSFAESMLAVYSVLTTLRPSKS